MRDYGFRVERFGFRVWDVRSGLKFEDSKSESGWFKELRLIKGLGESKPPGSRCRTSPLTGNGAEEKLTPTYWIKHKHPPTNQ